MWRSSPSVDAQIVLTKKERRGRGKRKELEGAKGKKATQARGKLDYVAVQKLFKAFC